MSDLAAALRLLRTSGLDLIGPDSYLLTPTRSHPDAFRVHTVDCDDVTSPWRSPSPVDKPRQVSAAELVAATELSLSADCAACSSVLFLELGDELVELANCALMLDELDAEWRSLTEPVEFVKAMGMHASLHRIHRNALLAGSDLSSMRRFSASHNEDPDPQLAPAHRALMARWREQMRTVHHALAPRAAGVLALQVAAMLRGNRPLTNAAGVAHNHYLSTLRDLRTEDTAVAHAHAAARHWAEANAEKVSAGHAARIVSEEVIAAHHEVRLLRRQVRTVADQLPTTAPHLIAFERDNARDLFDWSARNSSHPVLLLMLCDPDPVVAGDSMLITAPAGLVDNMMLRQRRGVDCGPLRASDSPEIILLAGQVVDSRRTGSPFDPDRPLRLPDTLELARMLAH